MPVVFLRSIEGSCFVVPFPTREELSVSAITADDRAGIVQEPLDLAVKLFGVVKALQHDGQVVVALAIALGAGLAQELSTG